MKSQLMKLLVTAALALWPAVASAQVVDAGPDAEADASAEIVNPATASTAPPLECGGDLCDSSTGSTCAMSAPTPVTPFALALAAVLPLAALARRRRR